MIPMPGVVVPCDAKKAMPPNENTRQRITANATIPTCRLLRTSPLRDGCIVTSITGLLRPTDERSCKDGCASPASSMRVESTVSAISSLPVARSGGERTACVTIPGTLIGNFTCFAASSRAWQKRETLAKRCEGSLERARRITLSSSDDGKELLSWPDFLDNTQGDGGAPTHSW